MERSNDTAGVGIAEGWRAGVLSARGARNNAYAGHTQITRFRGGAGEERTYCGARRARGMGRRTRGGAQRARQMQSAWDGGCRAWGMACARGSETQDGRAIGVWNGGDACAGGGVV